MSQRPVPPFRYAVAAGLFAVLLLALPLLAHAAPPRPIPGEYIIKYKPNVGPDEHASLRAQERVEQVHAYRYINADYVRIRGADAAQRIERLRRNPKVEYIEPNYEVSIDLTPNDLRYPELWAMHNTGQTGGTAGADIKATNAWDLFTGDPDLKVGVIDTGVDYNHPDLAANVWTNPGEIPGNGIDDDHNGYVDDVHGYDFVNNDGDPFDDNGHGSHCSGTIAGVGNNSLGVVGVCWRAKVVGIKFLSAAGSGSTANAILGVEYAITVGCRLTSNSWGGGGFSQALLDAINAAGTAGQLFIAAAGNNSQNTDVTPAYPASYDTPYIVSVAATDHNDNLASFSNYGATTVDLAAPGVSILSCQPGGGYQLLSGTSMATPHVAGVAALAMGRFPAASNLQIKQLILNAVDVKPQLTGKVLTNGRLNAFLTIAEPDDTPPGQVTDLATSGPSSNGMGLTWTATGDDGNVGRASSYEIRYSTSPITDLAGFLAATLVPGTPDPQPSGAAESFEVTGLDFSTPYYFALRAKDEFGNAGPVSNLALGTTLGIPNLAYSPGSFSAGLLTGGMANQVLTLSNTAAGTLDFTIPTPVLEFSQAGPYEAVEIGKGNPDWRVGDPVVQGKGGPDGFGYRWIDSDEPGGPAFAWVDITGPGTPVALTGDDAWSGVLPIGFDFPFYGQTFNSLRLSTNGFLSFTASSGAYYDNQPLPSGGAPPNLVAPFWDDQDFGTVQRAWVYNDGTRFIVSWIAVPAYQTGGPYTYQAILYPTGEVVFQYLTLGSPTNSATAGVQNATGSTGLTVAFNTAYFHDNLAVRVVPLRQWLRVSPLAGRIPAGGSQDLTVTFDATGLDGGSYDGTVRILSNDPDGSPADLPAHLDVTGAPDIAVSPASLDFGPVFVGATPTRVLTVSNPGTDVLNVAVSTSDATVSVDQASFALAPKQAVNLQVTWAPVAPAVLAGVLTLASNDPDTPSLDVPLAGTATPAPAFSVSPASFDETLLTNTSVARNLRVSNAGGSPFVFTAEAVVQVASGPVTVHTDDVELGKEVPDPKAGPAPLRAGGPDTFGYSYADSDEPGGPAFSWVDLTGIGTPVTLPGTGDDATATGLPLGFSFPFYGNSFSTVNVCSNGFLSFTSTSTSLSNVQLPNNGGAVPNNLLAVFWDDLNPGSSTPRLFYHSDGSRFVLSYVNVPRYSSGGPYTFQVILYPNGQIVYQYLSMAGTRLNEATIGIQNATKDDGLTVVYNQNYVKNDLAIRFVPPARFLTVTPSSGTVLPGGFLDLTVGFNAAGLFGGHYAGAVHIAGNDPVQPTLDVPAGLTVVGVPDIAASPATIDFGTTYVGFPQLQQLAVVNQGTDDLHVSSITFDDSDFGVDQSSFTVPPLGNAVLFVAFNPPVAGMHSATMTIHSDDPDTPELTVPLTGDGLIAPDVQVDPTSLSATVNVPGTATRTLNVSNTGGSDLSFTVGTQITAENVPVHAPWASDKKEEVDPRPGVLGSGGPDQFGYTWKDSDDPGGPVFDWVDITGSGTAVPFATGDDSNAQGVPIGFDFPFYGNSFSTVNVCTNGWLSFSNTSTDLSNDPLPNSGAPENLLALFWDDLVPGTSPPRVFRYSDGTRFIVSFVGVPRYSSGGPYTFQVILYPSGRIVYQYLDMPGTRLNEATIGIQNGQRDDGLTVVYNGDYVHDGLAIEIATVPDYLTVTPSSGTVPPGASLPLNVQFNTTGLFGGDYHGSIRVQSNDPARPVVNVPTTLTAIGTPHVAAEPAALDFGWLYLSQTRDLEVAVRNTGSDVARLDGVTLGNPDYALVGGETFPIELGRNAAHTFTVRFAPAAACNPCAGEMRVASNDPDQPELVIALTGTGIVPPEIATTPAELRAALATTLGPTALTTHKALVIENTGGSDLEWTAEALSALPQAVAAESGEVGKDDAGTPGAMGTGGPDAFGYRWADSNDPLGPAFDWIDITTIGTPLVLPGNGDDQNVHGIPIGFDFPFYGNTFGTINVCTNGWLSFTSTSTSLSNSVLPSTTAPENMLAPFWDDLDPDVLEPKIWTWGDGTRFVVSYVNVPRYSSGGPYTFQVILYPSGTIDYQYLDMQGSRLNEATVGIQNGTKDIGLSVVYNAAYVADHLRVRFSNQPGWLTVDRTSGTVAAGERDTLWVGFNASGLADGDYDGAVRIQSNDLDEPVIDVPALLHVGVEAATFDLDPNTLNRSSGGRWADGTIWPPAGHAPEGMAMSSVLLQRVVPADPEGPVGYDDGAVTCKFDRAALQACLPDGAAVPVEVIGRMGDETWFQGWDTIKVLRPRVASRTSVPGGGDMPASLPAPSTVTLDLTDPEGATASSFDLWYSADAGDTWSLVEGGITTRAYDWMVPATPTQDGRLELVALDADGVMGSWITNLFEILPQVTGIDDPPAPDHFSVRMAGGNPAARAILEMGLPARGDVSVQVFDVRGALVRNVLRGPAEAGWIHATWDGTDGAGRRSPAGVYFVRARWNGLLTHLRFVRLD